MSNNIRNVLTRIMLIPVFILATSGMVNGQKDGKNQRFLQANKGQERQAYMPPPSPLWTPHSTTGGFHDNNYDHALEQTKVAERNAAEKAKAAAAAERLRTVEERAKAKQEAKNKKLKKCSPRLSKKRNSKEGRRI